MQKFKTLLLREWMQHHRGWLILALVPLAIALLAIPFGTVQMDGGPSYPDTLAFMGMAGYGIGVLMLAWLAVFIQTPGMARRDQQDRSIEFWVSLPVAHWQSVLATVTMHMLLMPLMVLALAFAGGQLVGLVLAIKAFGFGALGEIPVTGWLLASGVGLARMVLGVVLGALWLSPVLLMAMAAAAWLKRWGVPLIAAVLGLGGLVLDKVYGNPIVFDVVGGIFSRAFWALVPSGRGQGAFNDGGNIDQLLQRVPAQVLYDTRLVLGDVASPWFVGALAVAALGFWLLVLRRQKGV